MPAETIRAALVGEFGSFTAIHAYPYADPECVGLHEWLDVLTATMEGKGPFPRRS